MRITVLSRWPFLGIALGTAIVVVACGSSGSKDDGNASSNSTSSGTSQGSAASSSHGGTSSSSIASNGSGSSATSGGSSSGASSHDGGAGDASNGTFDAQPPATTLTALKVSGNKIVDGSGNPVILRGVSLPDIGELAQTASGVSGRIDEVLNDGLAIHVVRLPVYPRTCFNGGQPSYSSQPFPVGQAAPSTTTKTITELSASDYIAQVLRPAVDYLASKNIYAIIDFHQIDNTTAGDGGASQSGLDAVTFWQTVAPAFANYPSVIFEAFNEPIDTAGMGWTAAFTQVAQSWVTTIRAASNNLIIVGSPNWSQYPDGVLTHPLTGGNLAFTAHAYPDNWPGTGNAFQTRTANAAAKVPVFMTEWGFQIGTSAKGLTVTDDSWGQSIESFVNAGGESWTAWVADPQWGPPMLTSTGLTDFGTFVKNWLGGSSSDAGATDQ